MAESHLHPSELGDRWHRSVEDPHHDSYKMKGKPKEPTVCPQCGAIFHKGRWSWGSRPAQAHETICPACHRINDKYPKGLLTLNGPFLTAHREEILGLAHHEEAKEKAEHPLARIMSIEDRKDGTVIATTDLHLPRRIGTALQHAYHGECTFDYDDGGQFIRAKWTR